MKIAYLVSRYPAVSHTFIMREVAALRSRGVSVGTFSVRCPTQREILGAEATTEAARTRSLVGAPFREYACSLFWALCRPVRSGRVLADAVAARGLGLRQRLQWLFYFAEAVLLAMWLKAGGYERLHCHFGNNGSSTGLLAAKLAGIPFSFTCHGSELLEPGRHRLLDKVASAAFVACVSKYGRAQLMLLCPPKQWSKLHLVRCGLELAQPPVAVGSAQPGELLCVARLSREKGHLVLLDALSVLRDSGTQVHCTLVGDGPMRSAIEKRIAELEIGDVVTLTGSLEPEAVLSLYRSARMLVLPSFSEGVPVVLMEAMSQGLPVIATRVGGVAELVRDRVHGFVVPPGDAKALVAAIGKLLADAALADRMGQRGQRRVRSLFALSRSADRLIRLFEAVYSPVTTPGKGREAPCRSGLAVVDS